MNPNGESPDPKRPSGVFPVMTPIKVGGQVAFITLFIVFLALFGGLALDRYLGTKPIFTIILLVGSAPLALYLTFWVAMRAVKDMQNSTPSKPSPAARANLNDEEEE